MQKGTKTADIDSEDEAFDGTFDWDSQQQRALATRGESVTAAESAPEPDEYFSDSDDVYSDDLEDVDDFAVYGSTQGRGPNAQSGQSSSARTYQPLQHRVAGITERMSLNYSPLPDDLTGTTVDQVAKNSIISGQKKAAQHRHRGLTQDTRATVEQVLDPRTRLILTKLLNRGLFSEIYGCISTGKEANVYYAVTEDGGERAVKIFKTSILVFKDRSRYVEGEFRFRRGYIKSSNPRRMVAQWAEKEYRNLKRIAASGIRCPAGIELRSHVLVMSFVGRDEVAAPRLKDAIADMTHDETWRAYVEVVATMRTLYQTGRLVHGDLSDYNLLWHDGHVTVIDVSQSVEHDHPHSLDFLKRDCVNVTAFFRKYSAQETQASTSTPPPGLLSVMTLFDWIIAAELPSDFPPANEDGVGAGEGEGYEAFDGLCARLDVWLRSVHQLMVQPPETAPADGDRRGGVGLTAGEAARRRHNEADEALFLETWMPSHLHQVSDLAVLEKEMERRQRGEDTLFERFLGTAPPSSAADQKSSTGDTHGSREEAQGEGGQQGQEEQESDGVAESDSNDDDDDQDDKFDGHRPDGVSKKEWKQKVKEDRREKRKTKMPKAVKKKAVNKAKNR
ncbi:unnamed protein product [Vitrella brassicaformis CCMP3155]|uniref:Serine/threonine-protein kinase RIO1 n=3 Tax=Vitrella brassicaformis TaxID=1169539 RepID=A0A0G4G9C6_VITBC|nr:unnamed protein product [Vitrella brassicaformis CCMP3155]|eukprot:CEM25434.1 unnamed protein product [Vitrella brassicaformis CCMP3155]